jgi:LAS superfamily LD-carboxypeptidase LdcB
VIALFIAAIVLWVVLMPRTAIAYVGGQPVEIQVKEIGRGATLRADAADAFNAMAEACAEETGFTLECSGSRSGFRTPEEQQALRDELGAYGSGGLAAAVGKSPHQTGTAVDIEGLDPAKPNYNTALRGWMDSRAADFGFINTGAAFVTTRELWHWQYKGVA